MKKSIILILILGACIFAFSHFAQNNRNELSELESAVQNIKLEYKSERGFGNDRFDIYSFSIEGEVNFNDDIRNLEGIYKKEFRSILNTESKKNQELKEKQNQIENLLEKKRFVYNYVIQKGTKKLYLYDSVSNKGYYFILKFDFCLIIIKVKLLNEGDYRVRYILLLRGINVGGKNKVVMSELKELLEGLNFQNVHSYINSGNLFFSSMDTLDTCICKIKDLLERHYDFSIPFALLTKEEYLKEKENLPEWWNEELARRDVLFFSYQLDKSSILEFLNKANFHNEIVHIGNHAVFWGKFDEAEYLKTTYHKQLLKQNFYKMITIRNGNTFEKIAQILETEK